MNPTTKSIKFEAFLEAPIEVFGNHRVLKSLVNVSKSMLQKSKSSIEVNSLVFRDHYIIFAYF